MKRVFVYLVLFILSSCREENFQIFSLLTEDPLFISGEKVQLVGRLITDANIRVDDHGFYLGINGDFTNPEIISMGLRSGPGRFIGEFNGLKPGLTYSVKSFSNINGDLTFGNVLEFRPLNPGILSFLPNYALPGELMQIKGINFNTDTRVFFDDQEVTVDKILFESYLTVKVPPIKDNPSPLIKVISSGQEMVFERNFEYMLGKFRFIGFPERFRLVDAVSFESQGKFYLLSGFDSEQVFNPYLWEFNPDLESWSKKNLGILPHISGFGSDGYFGGGFTGISLDNIASINHSFWYWNGNEIVKKADVPFPSIKSIAFMSKGKLFVIGGTAEGFENVISRYDPESDIWNKMPNFPFNIQANLPYFVYKDQLFFISERKELFKVDPETGQREIVGMYPGSNTNGLGVAVVLGNRAIIGLYRQEVEIWELDLITLNWKRKINFPGVFSGNNLALFGKDNLTYLLRSTNLTIPEFGNMEFWEFDPDGF